MRFTGLSGIDTESMITALMKAEGMKLDRLKQQNQLTQWTQSAYQSTAAVLKTFSNNFLSLGNAASARLSTSYLSNTNTVKNKNGLDSTAVKLTSSVNAQTGSYTMKVSQLAQKDVYVSQGTVNQGSIQGGVDLTASANLDKLRANDSFNISLDGTTKAITFSAEDITELNDGSTSMIDLINDKLSKAFGSETLTGGPTQKVKAELGANGQLEITTNKGHTVSISSGPARNTAQTGANDINLSDLHLTDADSTFDLNVSGASISVTLNENSTAEDVVQQINEAIQQDASITSGLKASLSKDENDHVKLVFSVGSTVDTVHVADGGGGLLSALGFNSPVDIEPTNVLGNLGLTSGASTKMDLSRTLGDAFHITGDVSFTINDETFTFSETTSVQDMMSEINNKNIGVTFSYDSVNEGFKLSSNSTGAVNRINGGNLFSDDPDGFLGTVLGFTNDPSSALGASSGQDAVFEFNGIPTTRDSNFVDMGGLKMELTGVTTDETGPLSINVSKNTSATLDFIKGFVDAYNTMIDGLSAQLNTSRPKQDSYNYFTPLTDEQKEAMNESDITIWETKAKTGLLYNDDLLSSISRNLRSMLYTPVPLDDKPASDPTRKTISLFEIGITTTSDYQNGGKLVIDETKLKAALEARGDDVAELFTRSSSVNYTAGKNDSQRIADEGLAERMNDIINNAIGSKGTITQKAGLQGDSFSELSSTMYLTLKDQNEKITAMLTYLQNKETSYYSMFSKMEQAITAANSQMSYMQAQLGI
jgi:flagellar hook-associated protein 2